MCFPRSHSDRQDQKFESAAPLLHHYFYYECNCLPNHQATCPPACFLLQLSSPSAYPYLPLEVFSPPLRDEIVSPFRRLMPPPIFRFDSFFRHKSTHYHLIGELSPALTNSQRERKVNYVFHVGNVQPTRRNVCRHHERAFLGLEL